MNISVEATVVDVYMYVGSLRSVSEATMTFELELYYREYWRDERLTFNPLQFGNQSKLSLHASLLDSMWIPDTFLPNAIDSANPEPDSVTHRSLLRLESSGHVLVSRRISVTAECPMDLSLYPFDHQVCALSIESYGHSIENLIYRWRDRFPVAVNPRLELPQLKLIDIITKRRNITLSTGTYSRLECCFVFERSAGFYFVQVFFPSTSVVVISWLFLWMGDASEWSDMMSVILAMTFLYYSYTSMMPKVSYIKAVDLYLTSCFLFVFLSLIKLTITRLFSAKVRESLKARKLSRKLGVSAITKGSVEYKRPSPGSNADFGRLMIPTIEIVDYEEQILCRNHSEEIPDDQASESETEQEEETETKAETEASAKREDIMRVFRLLRAAAIGIPLSFVIFGVSYFIAYICLLGQIVRMTNCDW